MTDKRTSTDELLEFRQSGEFHYRWALRYLDDDNVPFALHHLWQAVELSPDNVDYNLELAGLLSDIQRYDESNEILLMLMQNGQIPGECYYGLGCNFLGIGDMTNAADSLEQYLSREPDGDYIDDAMAMLDNINESRRDQLQAAEPESPDDTMRKRVREGGLEMQAGEFKKAIRTLEGVSLPDEEENLSVQNDLSVAYYYAGQSDRAAAIARRMLTERPGNLQALCNLALFTHKTDPERAGRAIDQAAAAAGSDPYLNYRVGVVLCEMGRHEQARAAMQAVALENPFDLRIQHYYALACYNSGQVKKAAAIWEQLRRMYPDDTVMGYYEKLAAARLRGEDAPDTLVYSIQVPVDEVIRRIREIGSRLQDSGSLKELGADGEIRKILLWGVTLKDSRLRKVMLQMMVAAGGEENERVLRRLLLNRQESNEFKQEIFLGLKAMDARQPFLALMDGRIVQVCVHVHQTDMEPVVKGYEEVVTMLGRHMTGVMQAHIDEAVALWNRFLVRQMSRGKPLRIKTPAVWAAALHGLMGREHDCPLTCRELARLYGAGAGSVGRCARRILAEAYDGEKESDDEDGTETHRF